MPFANLNRLVQLNCVLKRVILATALVASIAACTSQSFAVQPQVAIVHASDFGSSEDLNNDGWPDGWRRVFDREHPKYVMVRTNNREQISNDELQQFRRSLAQWTLAFEKGMRPGDIIPEKIPPQIDRILEDRIMNRCLEVEMDGGAMLIESKPFPVDRRFTYRFGAELRCDKLDDFYVQVSVVGLSSDGSEMLLGRSNKYSGTLDWQAIGIPNISVDDSQTTSAKIKVVVKPNNFRALTGKVSLDSVRVYRQPKLSVALNPTSHVIKAGQSITAECEITGLEKVGSSVQFQLRDVERRVVQKITCDVVTDATSPNNSAPGNVQYLGLCHTQITIEEPGYYELVIALNNTTRQDFFQILPIVVLPQTELLSPGQNDRFGLTIEDAGRAIPWADAIRITRELQLGNVKIPMWFDALQGNAIDGLAGALDAFNSLEIKPIAVLDRPPPSLVDKFPADTGSSLLTSLDQPAIWQPMLDPLLQRITLHVREFQLGWDHETALVRASKLPGIIQNVRTKLNAYEPESRLTLPCSLLSKESYTSSKLVHRFHLSGEPGMNADEITNYSECLEDMAQQRWISISSPDPKRYTTESTIEDLTDKMIAVANSKFPVAFFNQSSSHSIFDDQARPGILYLPIRNISNWLMNCDRIEFIELPANRRAALLFRDTKVNLLLFPNDSDVPEFRFWLGQDLQAVDVWGRPVNLVVDQNTTGKPIEVKNYRWPVLITDVNESLIRWQSAVELVSKDIVMTTTSAVELACMVKNPGLGTAIGTIQVNAPNLIREGNVDLRFSAQSGTEHIERANITLRSDVAEGDIPIKMIVKLESPSAVEFEMTRNVHVGLPGVRITSKSEFTKSGDLIIDVTIENQTQTPKSFDLMLFVPGRPRDRAQMISVKDTVVRRLVVPNAKSFQNDTLRLSCEEIGTGRTINHLIDVAGNK